MKNYKKFEEIKTGDIIYYFSHGKIHERKVIDVNDNWIPSWSNIPRKALMFKHGWPIPLDNWINNASQCGVYFTTIEELINSLKRRYEHTNFKCKELFNAYKHYSKLANDYSTALENYYNTHN